MTSAPTQRTWRRQSMTAPGNQARRALLFVAPLAGLLPAGLAHAQAEAPEADDAPFSLPPVPVDELRARAPEPSWDTGVLMAVCGVGNEQIWQRTQFCLGGMADVLWGRATEADVGFGAYGQIASAGFDDGRFSLGPSLIVSLVDWFSLGLRAGGLALVNTSGVAPGAEGYVELGHRSVSFDSRYSIGHALLAGLQWTARAGDTNPSSTALWLGVRFDGYWLTTPAALLR